MVRRINLVPAEQQRRTSTDLGLLLVVAAAVVVVAGIALSYFYFGGILSDKEAELAGLQTQNQQLQAQLAELAKYEEVDQRRQAAEDLVRQVYVGRTLVSEVLGDLSLVLPDNVWFANLSFTAPDPPPVLSPAQAGGAGAVAIQTSGSMTVTGNTYSFEDVATFLVRLEQIPAIGTVSLSSAGPANGAVDPEKDVKGFAVSATVHNVQPADSQLPVSRVEVETQ